MCEKSTNCLDRLGTDIDIRNNQFVKRGVSASQSVHRVARCQALTCAGSELQQSRRCGVLPQRIWYLHAAPRPSNNETNEQTTNEQTRDIYRVMLTLFTPCSAVWCSFACACAARLLMT